MNYIETFEIPGAGRYRISQEGNNFKVWSGGSAVGGCPVGDNNFVCTGPRGSAKTLEEARCYIHNHAKETLSLAILNAEHLLKKLNASNNALKPDVFYLGKFLVENT